MRRIPSNITDQFSVVRNSEPDILVIKQETASSLPRHPVTALLHTSRIVKVKTMEKMQCMVDNANMKVLRARSHFRARLWSPLVLFDGENLVRSSASGRLGEGCLTLWREQRWERDINISLGHEGSVIRIEYVREVAGMTI
jgi:hypothetical protein